MDLKGYKQESRSTDERAAKREKLYELFKRRPMPDDQLLISLGLFMRSSALTKILFINELYQNILDIPGVIMEFGVWWGQNLVLFENLRAIYEPFNYDRRIVGFDTFEGYPKLSEKDVRSETIQVGGYTVSPKYEDYLMELIDFHEQENVLYSKRKHMLVKGDATKTVPEYLSKHPETIISLAYFDMALYEPTKKCLEAICPHLIKGSTIVIDELNANDQPGETLALRDTWGWNKYQIRKSKFMPGRSYLIID